MKFLIVASLIAVFYFAPVQSKGESNMLQSGYGSVDNFMCPGKPRMIIANDINEAVALCSGAPEYCEGFSDAGCDGKGPFVLCDSGDVTLDEYFSSSGEIRVSSKPYNICFYMRNHHHLKMIVLCAF